MKKTAYVMGADRNLGNMTKKGMIFDIDHFAVHDGPGIRAAVYLKGCPLRCFWCHSPESQRSSPEILYISSKCIQCGSCSNTCTKHLQQLGPDGTRSYNRTSCTVCGQCVAACPQHALVVCGRLVSAAEVIREVADDEFFYKNSGGGVTITGGEVLAQPLFALELLKGIKEHGIHTIIETCGMGKLEDLTAMVPYTDIFYYDIKIMDKVRHLQFTGKENAIILSNLSGLRKSTDCIVLRVPLIPGYTDDNENIKAIYEMAVNINIRTIHLLPYNSSAPAKYEWLGGTYSPGIVESQNDQFLDHLKSISPDTINIEIII